MKKVFLPFVAMGFGAFSQLCSGVVSAATAVEYDYYVSPVAETGAAFTSAQPGALKELLPRMRENLKRADAENRVIARETVHFLPGTYAFTDWPTNKEGAAIVPAVKSDTHERLEFVTEGMSGSVVLDGAGYSGRAMNIIAWECNRDADMLVRGFTFRNFSTSGSGGAILSSSERLALAVEDCRFENCRAGKNGGALCGAPSVRGCTFERCSAGVHGAAVMSVESHNLKDRASVTDSRIVDCLAPEYWEPQLKDGWPGARGNESRLETTAFGGYLAVTNVTVAGTRRMSAGRKDGGVTANAFTVRTADDFAKARDFLRANRDNAKPAEVVVEDGVYELTNTLVLAGEDGFTTWRARHPGKVTVVGGWSCRGVSAKRPSAALLARLPEVARGRALAIVIPEGVAEAFRGVSAHRYGIPSKQVTFTVDGAYMDVAQWPSPRAWFWMRKEYDLGVIPRGAVTNRLVATTASRQSEWTCTDAYAWGFLRGDAYSCGSLPLLGNERGKGGIEYPQLYGRYSFSYNDVGRFRFMNILEELDEPGEWCFDSASATLVFWPRPGFGEGSLCAVGTTAQPLFEVRADDVTFEGFTFTSKRESPVFLFRHGTGGGVVNCRFSGVNNGVRVATGYRRTVRGCDFDSIQANGVFLGGGDLDKVVHGENVVENCSFSRFAFFRNGFALAAVTLRGCGNAVRHCEMHDSIEHAIDFFGFDQVLEYNRIWNVSQEFGDSGAVYGSGVICYGSVVQYNDIGSAPGYSNGIYLDDFCCGVTVRGNIVRNFGYYGIFCGGGRDLVIENNIVTAGWGGIHTDNRGLWWPNWKDAKKTMEYNRRSFGGLHDGPIAQKYPHLREWPKDVAAKLYAAPVDCVYRRNLMLDLTGYSTSFFVAHKRFPPKERTTFEDNLVVRTRGLLPGRLDMASGDSSKIPTNAASAASCSFVPIVPVRILDGTPESPIDLGFRDVPVAAFNSSEYMWEQQGWINTPELRKFRENGKAQNMPFRLGDFSQKPDARIAKEIPGWQEIPFAKIGLYRDRWRTSDEQLR